MIFADTTFLIDFLRSKQRAKEIVEENRELCTSEINAYELFIGTHNKKEQEIQKQQIHELLNLLTVFPFERKAAEKAAGITADLEKKGEMIAQIDTMIAATAIVNKIKIIYTENTSHFARIPELEARKHRESTKRL